MAVASPKPAASSTTMRRITTDEMPAKAVPEFSQEQELTAFRQMLAYAASRRRPGSSTGWG